MVHYRRKQLKNRSSNTNETRKILLCTEGSADDVSQSVTEFLEYVAGRSITGSFAENLESEVRRAKDEEKWRVEYMQNMAVIMDARREGKAEGRAEGLAEGRMEQSRVFYQNCIKRGMSDEDARALSGYQGKG